MNIAKKTIAQQAAEQAAQVGMGVAQRAVAVLLVRGNECPPEIRDLALSVLAVRATQPPLQIEHPPLTTAKVVGRYLLDLETYPAAEVGIMYQFGGVGAELARLAATVPQAQRDAMLRMAWVQSTPEGAAQRRKEEQEKRTADKAKMVQERNERIVAAAAQRKLDEEIAKERAAKRTVPFVSARVRTTSVSSVAPTDGSSSANPPTPATPPANGGTGAGGDKPKP